MCAKIHYKTPDGMDVIDRDEYHFQREPFCVAFDNPDQDGVVEGKVTIPLERVVRVDG